MRSEARKQAGEAFGSGDMETVMADLVSPDNVLWRSGAVIPAASAPGEGLGYLTHHRIFACLSGNCGLQEITPATERARRSR
jgi:hypothetical protein